MLADRYRHLQLLYENRTNKSGQMTQNARKCKKISGFKPTSTQYSLECFVLSNVIRICTKTNSFYNYRDHMCYKSNYIKVFQKSAVLCLISYIVPEISLKVVIQKCLCFN
jgi:hypothetical protein